ncbi:hypothetical protein HDK64DRAFT_263209 [Phyllosticta capitalensis]
MRLRANSPQLEAMVRPTLALRTTLFAAQASLVVLGQNCYYPNGKVSTDDRGFLNDGPCTHNDGFSMCCPLNWICLSNWMCQNPDTKELGRYTCTDENWQSDACPKFCDGIGFTGKDTPNSTDSGNCAIIDMGNDKYCCNGDNSGNCSNEHPALASFQLPDIPSSVIGTVTSVGLATISQASTTRILQNPSSSAEVSVAVTTDSAGDVATTTVWINYSQPDQTCQTIRYGYCVDGSDHKSSSTKSILAIAISLGISLPLVLGAVILLFLRRRRKRRDQTFIQSNTYNANQELYPHRRNSVSGRARSWVVHLFSAEHDPKSNSTASSEVNSKKKARVNSYDTATDAGGEKTSGVPELDGFPKAAGGPIMSTPHMAASPNMSAYPTINSTLQSGWDGTGTYQSEAESRCSINDTRFSRGSSSLDGGGANGPFLSRHGRMATEKDGVALPVELEAREARRRVASIRESVGTANSRIERIGGQKHSPEESSLSSPKDHQTWQSNAGRRGSAVGAANGAGQGSDTEGQKHGKSQK